METIPPISNSFWSFIGIDESPDKDSSSRLAACLILTWDIILDVNICPALSIHFASFAAAFRQKAANHFNAAVCRRVPAFTSASAAFPESLFSFPTFPASARAADCGRASFAPFPVFGQKAARPVVGASDALPPEFVPSMRSFVEILIVELLPFGKQPMPLQNLP